MLDGMPGPLKARCVTSSTLPAVQALMKSESRGVIFLTTNERLRHDPQSEQPELKSDADHVVGKDSRHLNKATNQPIDRSSFIFRPIVTKFLTLTLPRVAESPP